MILKIRLFCYNEDLTSEQEEINIGNERREKERREKDRRENDKEQEENETNDGIGKDLLYK
jgi:hypothetical protein